jgi:hypothetical protein
MNIYSDIIYELNINPDFEETDEILEAIKIVTN